MNNPCIMTQQNWLKLFEVSGKMTEIYRLPFFHKKFIERYKRCQNNDDILKQLQAFDKYIDESHAIRRIDEKTLCMQWAHYFDSIFVFPRDYTVLEMLGSENLEKTLEFIKSKVGGQNFYQMLENYNSHTIHNTDIFNHWFDLAKNHPAWIDKSEVVKISHAYLNSGKPLYNSREKIRYFNVLCFLNEFEDTTQKIATFLDHHDDAVLLKHAHRYIERKGWDIPSQKKISLMQEPVFEMCLPLVADFFVQHHAFSRIKATDYLNAFLYYLASKDQAFVIDSYRRGNLIIKSASVDLLHEKEKIARKHLENAIKLAPHCNCTDKVEMINFFHDHLEKIALKEVLEDNLGMNIGANSKKAKI